MEYTVEYFISKFEAIPEENWFTGNFKNAEGAKFCAYGHCGISSSMFDDNPEGSGLINIAVDNNIGIGSVNDGVNKNYRQPTPKQRILAALYDIKDKELSQANVIEVEKIINTVVEEPLNV